MINEIKHLQINFKENLSLDLNNKTMTLEVQLKDIPKDLNTALKSKKYKIKISFFEKGSLKILG